MAKNLKIEGNFFVITDTISSEEDIRNVAGGTVFTCESTTLFFFKNSTLTAPLAKEVAFNLANIIDDRTGLAFPTLGDLKLFLSESIGFFFRS